MHSREVVANRGVEFHRFDFGLVFGERGRPAIRFEEAEHVQCLNGGGLAVRGVESEFIAPAQVLNPHGKATGFNYIPLVAGCRHV